MKDKRILYITGIVLLFLMSVGLSYAYFSSSISGNADSKDMVVEAGTLRLVYTDSKEIVMENIKPGESITKVVTVKNTGTLDAKYNLIWQELTNEIINDEMVISATCKRLNGDVESGTCEGVEETAIKKLKVKENVLIEPNITHEYTITITFKETGENQNYNQGKAFSGVLGISEYKVPETVYCTFDGEMVQGAEYVNGQYTYKYMQEFNYIDDYIWTDIEEDGWGVKLIDKTSTNPVTSKLCTYINDKPVVSMSLMFTNSVATTLDLSNFDTSNVTNMYAMFAGSKATTLDLSNFDTGMVTDMGWMFEGSKATTLNLSNFDTSKVTDMNNMFYNSQATTLDLSNFDTSKVTDMSAMFAFSKATTLNLSNFDTSNVTNMDSMFYNSQATTLNLSNFNTHNVTNMNLMFTNSVATTLDLSSFDTSNVTDMNGMFSNSQATTLDLSNFDTGMVTDMGWMFSSSKATTLDLSNFDTSKVTDMSAMFQSSKATTLNLSNFDTGMVTGMGWMFHNSKATTLNLSNFDTSNVTNMYSMFSFSKATTLDLSSFDTSNVTNMSEMFKYSSKLKTIYASDKFNTDMVTDSTNMFASCSSLVGGAGTKHYSTKVDKTYARIDGGTSSPGYFTAK